MTDHYVDCTNLACPGCLPTDEQVAALTSGQAIQEARRRGLRVFGNGTARIEAILADADDYRARAAATRAALEDLAPRVVENRPRKRPARK